MKNNLHLSVCIFTLLCCVLPAQAQVKDEIQRYQQTAGNRSILFRGEQAARYTFPVNGHPYWIRPTFERGDIVFEGNIYTDQLINVDAVQQQALVQLEGGLFAVALSPAQTPSFTMGGRHFVGIGPGENLPEGFYEVFGSGAERVYKHVYKQIESTTTNANGDTIGYYDEHYRPEVTRHFTYRKRYYFRDAEGNFSRFKSRSALLRRFPEHKKELRRVLRNAHLNEPGADFDAFCEVVLNYTAQ